MSDRAAAPRETKVRWGVLGVAEIATKKVIPAMQRGEWTQVDAIASRDAGRARDAAAALKIPKAYGSYEELLGDPDIDAVYIPLPNHLHVPWTIRAAEAGKHVLCEKPIGLTAAEARSSSPSRDRTGVQIKEAFMVRTHPQWLRALDIVRSGASARLRSIAGFFSYFNDDASNVRNMADLRRRRADGHRLLSGQYGADDLSGRAAAGLRVDRGGSGAARRSAVVDAARFPSGQAIGTCSTQLAPSQRVAISGTRGRIEVEIPFNAPPDRPCRLAIEDGSNLGLPSREYEEIETCDQYTIQGDLFSQAVRQGRPVPYPLEDSVNNLRVIDALFRSARHDAWEPVETGPTAPKARRR